MSQQPPPLHPASPQRPPRGSVAGGTALGFALGLVIVIGSPIAGAAIDSSVNKGQDLAGLAGLLFGAIGGGILLLACMTIAFTRGSVRNSATARGVGIGLLLVLGVIALAAGACAVLATR